ncbi:MAG: MerR family transcriptional regulator [Candidatus Omnitrophica bacterium]|nr:MerR family transcriptional regulator [Candidatus Omnitrophota bacterium]
MNKNLISSKEIVAKFAISYPALTHYTNIGLLHVVARNGNKRLYSFQEVKIRIPKIRQLTNGGYPLRLIVKELNQGRS